MGEKGYKSYTDQSIQMSTRSNDVEPDIKQALKTCFLNQPLTLSDDILHEHSFLPELEQFRFLHMRHFCEVI